jgi:transcriptional regulator GlxA family with amidase domain
MALVGKPYAQIERILFSLAEKKWLLSAIKELVNSAELSDRDFQKAFKAALPQRFYNHIETLRLSILWLFLM